MNQSPAERILGHYNDILGYFVSHEKKPFQFPKSIFIRTYIYTFLKSPFIIQKGV